MNNNYIESLDNLFNGEALSTEGLKDFFNESMDFIGELQAQLTSPDEKTRETALQNSVQIKQKLEEKLKGIAERSGIDLDELAALTQNTKNMTREEQQTIEEMEQKFQTFKAE